MGQQTRKKKKMLKGNNAYIYICQYSSTFAEFYTPS